MATRAPRKARFHGFPLFGAPRASLTLSVGLSVLIIDVEFELGHEGSQKCIFFIHHAKLCNLRNPRNPHTCAQSVTFTCTRCITRMAIFQTIDEHLHSSPADPLEMTVLSEGGMWEGGREGGKGGMGRQGRGRDREGMGEGRGREGGGKGGEGGRDGTGRDGTGGMGQGGRGRDAEGRGGKGANASKTSTQTTKTTDTYSSPGDFQKKGGIILGAVFRPKNRVAKGEGQ